MACVALLLAVKACAARSLAASIRGYEVIQEEAIAVGSQWHPRALLAQVVLLRLERHSLRHLLET